MNSITSIHDVSIHDVLVRARKVGCEVAVCDDGSVIVRPPEEARVDPFDDHHVAADLDEALDRLLVYEVHMMLERTGGRRDG
jgi:hypothetical protein